MEEKKQTDRCSCKKCQAARKEHQDKLTLHDKWLIDSNQPGGPIGFTPDRRAGRTE